MTFRQLGDVGNAKKNLSEALNCLPVDLETSTRREVSAEPAEIDNEMSRDTPSSGKSQPPGESIPASPPETEGPGPAEPINLESNTHASTDAKHDVQTIGDHKEHANAEDNAILTSIVDAHIPSENHTPPNSQNVESSKFSDDNVKSPAINETVLGNSHTIFAMFSFTAVHHVLHATNEAMFEVTAHL